MDLIAAADMEARLYEAEAQEAALAKARNRGGK